MPDHDSLGGEATEPALYVAGGGSCDPVYSQNACRRKIIGSGTYNLAQWVNGKWYKKSVHVQAAHLKLAANPIAVQAGGSVTFTPAWSDGSAISASQVSGWTWTPDTPPGTTVACGVGVLPCQKAVNESGTMKVSVTRNGVTRTARVHVVVYTEFRLDADKSSAYVGDTVTFTPKLNGAAHPAARWRWVPTTGNDAVACANGITNCRKEMLVSGTMWAYLSSTSDGDSASAAVAVRTRFKVECSPTTIVRGGSVSCHASAEPTQPFTVVSRDAFSSGFYIRGGGIAGGPLTEYTWGPGTAVTSTTVLIEARLDDGTFVSGTGTFFVTPRSWSAWQLANPPDSVAGIRASMPRRLRGSGVAPVLATYNLRDLEAGQVPAVRVNVGPDSGLAYLASQPSLNGADIFFHPDLLPGTSFYLNQNGSPSGTCNQSDMLVLWTEIRRHEGRTQASNSHYGVTNMALLELRPDMIAERRYLPDPSPNDTTSLAMLRSAVQYEFWEWRRGPHHTRQAAFDSADYPLIQQTVGCNLDTSR